jgi:hypothetical protein
LEGELLKELVKGQGGVGAFLDHWNSVVPDADDHPNDSTLYRWISGKILPKNSNAFLRLAGLLDVDPFGLITVPAGDVLAAAEDVLRIVQNSGAAPAWLQFVHAFFGRQKSWPPEELSKAYYGRPWFCQTFNHDPAVRSNYYATILLGGLLKPPNRRPQILHFAFKHPSLFHARWLEYGLVRVHGTSVALHHINGYMDQLERTVLELPVRVETWFGPGPALFRIASLHPFDLDMADEDLPTAGALRFPG